MYLRKLETSYKVINFKRNFILFVFSDLLFFVGYLNTYIFFFKLFKQFTFNLFFSFFNIKMILNLLTYNIKYYYNEFILDGLYYRVKYFKKYNSLVFILGYNHYIIYYVPNNVKIFCHVIKRRFVLFGYEKNIIGTLSAEIVNLKYPNLFKGRGIKLVNFNYRKKQILKKK